MAEQPRQMSRLPAWTWRDLPEEERRFELEELADWAAELQEGFGRWVRLPPCWPLHRALREELAALWYWRQRLEEAPDAGPEEAVRWLQSLRLAAQVWVESYGGCRHESLGEVDERRDGRDARRAAMKPYLVAALRGAVSSSAAPTERSDPASSA